MNCLTSDDILMMYKNGYSIRQIASESIFFKQEIEKILANKLKIPISHIEDEFKNIWKQNNESLELVLIRGLPGAGKSTLAKSMQDYVHFEADMFFIKNKKYQFDISQIDKAHLWCLKKTEKTLKADKSVVVSNTFTRHWELQPYIDLAKKMRIKLTIKVATGNYTNTHNVPIEIVKKMTNLWEQHPLDNKTIHYSYTD